jgi:hypothetical protein
LWVLNMRLTFFKIHGTMLPGSQNVLSLNSTRHHLVRKIVNLRPGRLPWTFLRVAKILFIIIQTETLDDWRPRLAVYTYDDKVYMILHNCTMHVCIFHKLHARRDCPCKQDTLIYLKHWREFKSMHRQK